MGRRRIAAGAALVILAGLLLICCKKEDGDRQNASPGPTRKRTSIEAFGIVVAKEIHNINITFPAEIKKIYVRNGESVKSGDKLVELELSDYRATIRRKELELAEAEYELERIKVANYNMESAAAYVKKLRCEIKKFELNVLQDKLRQDILDRNLLISNITNGIVTDILYHEGDHISSEKKVLTLYDVDSYIIHADVPEEFIKDVALGANVDIIPSSFPDKTFKGAVERIAELAYNKNGETVVPVEIKILDNDGTLWPNFNVDIKVYTGPSGSVER